MTEGAARRSFRVVIAEDDPDQLTLYRLVLEQQPDLQVVAAVTDGAAAVAAVRSVEPLPDLVILDASMPRMTGVEAAAVIREVAPGTKILIISAEKTAHDLALEAGADAFLPKLFDIRSFVEMVRQLCSGEELT